MTRFHALVIFLAAASGLRVAYDRALAPARTAVPLRVPFSELPMDILGRGWDGNDVQLDPETLQVAQVTSYLQRRYRRGNHLVWLYVGYVGGRTTDAIHHPDVCFPTMGLRLSRRGELAVEVGSPPAAATFKEYLWESATGGGTYTLSTFFYNGKFDPDESSLRAERLFGVRYFAVITLSVNVPGSVDEARRILLGAVGEVVPRLLKHFPDGIPVGGTENRSLEVIR